MHVRQGPAVPLLAASTCHIESSALFCRTDCAIGWGPQSRQSGNSEWEQGKADDGQAHNCRSLTVEDSSHIPGSGRSKAKSGVRKPRSAKYDCVALIERQFSTNRSHELSTATPRSPPPATLDHHPQSHSRNKIFSRFPSRHE